MKDQKTVLEKEMKGLDHKKRRNRAKTPGFPSRPQFSYDIIYPNRDLQGNSVKRTKLTHPYNYDTFVMYDNRQKNGKNTDGAYSDRMMQWDWHKFNELVEKHFGNKGQYWYNREPNLIEKFLQDYFDKPGLRLCYILESCNSSNGYPYWYFAWKEV